METNINNQALDTAVSSYVLIAMSAAGLDLTDEKMTALVGRAFRDGIIRGTRIALGTIIDSAHSILDAFAEEER